MLCTRLDVEHLLVLHHPSEKKDTMVVIRDSEPHGPGPYRNHERKEWKKNDNFAL